MLESIRKHQKLLQWVLLLLIFPSFAFFGIESYMRNAGRDSDLVKINGQSITRQELDRAVKIKADRLQQQGRSDPSVINSLAFKQSVLGEIVQQRLVAYELSSLKLSISPDVLAKDLQQIPEVKSLYKSDGQFDSQKYKQLLANNGMSVDQFENGRRYELMSRQALSAVMATGIGSRKLAEQISIAYATEREIQSLQLNAADLLTKVTPTQGQLEDFYQANAASYQSPETIDVEYVVLLGNPKDDPKLFADRADLLANLAYEQPDSLRPIVDRLKLTIQSTKGINKAGLKALSGDHPLNNPKVISAVFSDDAIKNRRNTEAIELAPGKVLVARVSNHQPQQALPLTSVIADVKKRVSLKMAQELAVKIGQERYESLKKNPQDTSGFGSSKTITRNKPGDLSADAIDAIMGVDVVKLPTFTSSTSSNGYTIYKIIKVQKPTQVDSKLLLTQTQQLAQLTTQSEAASYFDSVKERAGVKNISPIR